MTDMTPKRPDQTTLDLAVLSGLFRDKHTALLSGAFGAMALLILLGASGALDGFIFWRDYNPYGQDMTPLRIGTVVGSGLLGFGLGWFFSPGAAIARAFILGALGGALSYLTIVDQAVIGWSAATVFAWIAFFAGFGYWARGFVERLREHPTTFGSAAWASMRDMLTFGLLDGVGFRLGFVSNADGLSIVLHYGGDRHMLTIAPNRSGKGIAAIIPVLLTYTGSSVVIDPKGENCMITAGQRKAMGQRVFAVDPWGITGMETARFNPMDWLKAGDVDIAENALLLADAIIITMGENEQFWTEEAKALLLGVILYVATHPDEEGQRHLGRVRDLLLLNGDDLNALFKRMLKSPHHTVRATGARCLQKEEKLLSNVLASVQAQTHFLDSPRLRDNLSSSDFTFEDLKTKPMTVYLVLPSDRLNAYSRWLRLLIQQALTVNARNIEIKPKKSVLFILDEMPALGKLTMVEQAFGLMAGYGMQLWGVVQDASQLKRIYGDGWETFIANAGVLQYFGSRDQMTAEYFSKLCGVTTVWDITTGVSRAIGISRGKDTSHSDTTTTSDTAAGKARQLAYADELMRMPKGKQLLLVGNMNPIIADKKSWFEDPDLKELGVNLHAELEDDPTDDESDNA
jgi:type IV secretion system protein VirD4